MVVVPTNYVSFYLFCDFKPYFSERNFAVVPTFKEWIYKIQILTFFGIMVFMPNLSQNKFLF
ncbi:hypothetical protein [Leptospira kirschneri]|uniref:hypothetical protein n=1 Tax=Leptospira kirschneri TaxID=29507 RepID=UPI0009B72198|nr:hypothetical protein [Leptospira kirschneri]UML82247.1 hypothetical protein FH602_15860 [Leptospira kirschneri]